MLNFGWNLTVDLSLPFWNANSDSTQPYLPGPRCQKHALLLDCPSATPGSPLAYCIFVWRKMFGTPGFRLLLLRQSVRRPLLIQLWKRIEQRQLSYMNTLAQINRTGVANVTAGFNIGKVMHLPLTY